MFIVDYNNIGNGFRIEYIFDDGEIFDLYAPTITATLDLVKVVLDVAAKCGKITTSERYDYFEAVRLGVIDVEI